LGAFKRRILKTRSDQQRDRPHSGEQVLKELLIRFLGCDVPPSWKLAPETSARHGNSKEFEEKRLPPEYRHELRRDCRAEIFHLRVHLQGAKRAP